MAEPTSLWPEVFDAVAASATVLAAFGGAIAAARYGRRANVKIRAEAYVLGDRTIVAVRPSVQAVGLFSLHIDGKDSAVVTVTEVVKGSEGLEDGASWTSNGIFENDDLVVSGETIRDDYADRRWPGQLKTHRLESFLWY